MLKTTLSLKTGAIEPLLVQAVSTSTLGVIAYSTIYTKDVIKYDITEDTTYTYGDPTTYPPQPTKGRIVERIDEWNNRTDYDHRVVVFKLYDNGVGDFIEFFDTGNTYEEFTTFDLTQSGNNYLSGFYAISKTTVGVDVDIAPNVFKGFAINNSVTGFVYLNIIDGYCVNNNFSGATIKNKFLGGLEKVEFSGGIDNNIFYGLINHATFGGRTTQSIFYPKLYVCNVSNYTNSLTVQASTSDEFRNVTFTGDLTSKTIDIITPSQTGLFNTSESKEILQSSAGTNYWKIFDGTIYQFTLIP